MSTPARTSLLRRLIGLPAQRPALDDDACDMGTAIGLDYSLDQAPLTETKRPPAIKPARPAWARRRQA